MFNFSKKSIDSDPSYLYAKYRRQMMENEQYSIADTNAYVKNAIEKMNSEYEEMGPTIAKIQSEFHPFYMGLKEYLSLEYKIKEVSEKQLQKYQDLLYQKCRQQAQTDGYELLRTQDEFYMILPFKSREVSEEGYVSDEVSLQMIMSEWKNTLPKEYTCINLMISRPHSYIYDVFDVTVGDYIRQYTNTVAQNSETVSDSMIQPLKDDAKLTIINWLQVEGREGIEDHVQQAKDVIHRSFEKIKELSNAMENERFQLINMKDTIDWQSIIEQESEE